MRARILKSLVIVLLLTGTCYGQNSAAVYRPFHANQVSVFGHWDLLRQAVVVPSAEGNRPVLPGVNGKNLELLQDGIARKWARKVPTGSLSAARAEVAQITPFRLPAIRGYMAEAMFLDLNSDWRYVSKPNASQHDVYAKMHDGRPGIQTGQIKFRMSGTASIYMRDMVKDYRSGNFFVPDDHVDQLRISLKNEADRLRAMGDNAGAAARYRDMNRVKGIGATSIQIDNATREAITEARMVRVAPYMFVGTATVLLAAPTLWDWHKGEIDAAEATYRLTKGGSTIFSAIAVDQTLKQWKGGFLRGTLRGNMILASVILLSETSWQIYEYSGINNALQQPEFIIDLSGNVSAISLGFAGGYAGMIAGGKAGGAIGTFWGPEGTPVGATIGSVVGGIITGSAAGTAGYFGGSRGARWAMETFLPEKLYGQEQAYIHNLRQDIENSITSLQSM